MSSCVSSLQRLKQEEGLTLASVYKDIGLYVSGEVTKFKSCNLHDNQNFRTSFKRSACEYLDILIANINLRFEAKSMKLLEDLDLLLNPNRVDRSADDSLQHMEALSRIASTLGETRQGNDSQIPLDEEQLTVILPPIVQPLRMRADYIQWKMFLRSLNPNIGMAALAKLLLTTSIGEAFPDFKTMSSILTTAPVASVSCERGFSTQNRLKTKHRASMDEATMDKLARIRLHQQNVNIHKAAVIHAQAKVRRK